MKDLYARHTKIQIEPQSAQSAQSIKNQADALCDLCVLCGQVLPNSRSWYAAHNTQVCPYTDLQTALYSSFDVFGASETDSEFLIIRNLSGEI